MWRTVTSVWSRRHLESRDPSGTELSPPPAAFCAIFRMTGEAFGCYVRNTLIEMSKHDGFIFQYQSETNVNTRKEIF